MPKNIYEEVISINGELDIIELKKMNLESINISGMAKMALLSISMIILTTP